MYYSFFLEALRKEGYTASKVRELSSYAGLIGKPSGLALAQNIGFVSLITFMIALSTEVIKSFSNFASGMGVELIAMGLVGAYFYWMVWGGVHGTTYERVKVKRFLKLAAHDLA